MNLTPYDIAYSMERAIHIIPLLSRSGSPVSGHDVLLSWVDKMSGILSGARAQVVTSHYCAGIDYVSIRIQRSC